MPAINPLAVVDKDEDFAMLEVFGPEVCDQLIEFIEEVASVAVAESDTELVGNVMVWELFITEITAPALPVLPLWVDVPGATSA